MSNTSRTNRLYWLLQIIGWSLYACVGIMTNVRFNNGVEIWKIAGLAVSGASLLFLLTHLLRAYSKRHDWFKLTFGRLILRLFLGTFILSAISQAIVSLLMFWPIRVISEEQPYSIAFLAIYIVQTQIILLLWSLIYFSYHAIQNYKFEEVEKWKLQAAVKDAELIALKAQINPHFIFNCLNNIRALVLEDANKARESITKLSDLLRSSIEFNKAEKVTVASEIAMVRDYLELETIHMEDRLQYSITSDPSIDSFEIPPMSVQLLVENAIKHCLSKLPNGGSIDVKIQSVQTGLVIEVLNTGQIHENKVGRTGIGLSNIRERLTLLYGINAKLTLENVSNVSVLAKIVIP